MSRNHYYHSPYGGYRRASRWPWLFGVLIIAAVAATATVLVQGDLIEVPSVPSGIVPGTDSDPDDPADAPAGATNTQPSAAPQTAPPPQGQAPAATDTGPAAVQGHGDGTGQFMDEMPGQVAVAAEATAAPPPLTPVEVAEQYAARWSAGDYDGMYDLLSTVSKAQYPRSQFVERYQGIVDKAGLTAVAASVTGEPNLQGEVPLRVEMTSSLVGEFGEMNRVTLVQENGQWRVSWTPSLIFSNLGADGCVDFAAQSASRGSILDRDGDKLAYDGPINQVGIQPGAIKDEQAMLRDLSQLIDMPAEEIKAAYEGADPSWFVLVKNLPDPVSNDVLNGIADLAAQGVSVQKTTGRVYPLGAKAAHITGYISEVTQEQLEQDPSLVPGQLIGQAGVEAGANDLLTGQPGGRLIVVQCETRGERATIAEREPVPAKDIVLTIDADFQQAVDAALTESLKQTMGAQPGQPAPNPAIKPEEARASAVVLDPRTGAVLAMVSHPSYDPNGFTLGFSEQDAQAFNDEKLSPWRNRAAQAAYPTGSIFKAITMAAAMAKLGYTGETMIECPATFTLQGANGQVIEFDDWTVDYGRPPQGQMSLHNALVNSCNTAFYQLGDLLDQKDDQLLPDVAKAFGLGAATDIPYLPEVAGTVPDPQWKLDTFGDYWARGDAVNMAIGQGFVEATRLQMATAYAAIANGGALLKPYIVAEVVNPLDGARERVGNREERGRLPLNEAQVQELQSALRDQTSNPQGVGSARVFGDFAYPIAGKTGTAENQTDKNTPHSWFASFGPYGEEATIATIVMVETAGEGVVHAAPATRKIYEAYLQTDLAQAPT